jgi:predicted HTH domain antitoxin
LSGARAFEVLASKAHSLYSAKVILTLPEGLEARLSPQAMALHLAIGLFVAEEATLGQAAEVAGLTQTEFLHELGRRHIPIHYGLNELREDLKTIEALDKRP